MGLCLSSKSLDRTLLRAPSVLIIICYGNDYIQTYGTGNALHYCNCHGTGCNKDWTSADGGGGQQTTPSGPGNTIKYVFVFVTHAFLYVFLCVQLFVFVSGMCAEGGEQTSHDENSTKWALVFGFVIFMHFYLCSIFCVFIRNVRMGANNQFFLPLKCFWSHLLPAK